MTTLIFFVENHLLALATLELVCRHDYVRINELNSYIHTLTSELAIVCNEREQLRVEMVRLGIIGPDFGMNPRHPINRYPLEEAVVGAQEGEELVADADHGFNLGMENRSPATNVFVLALDIQQSNIRVTEVMSHIAELNSEIAKVSSERDQFREALERINNNNPGWGRFRFR